MWCRCFMRRSNGSRAGPTSSIRPRRRCTGRFRKPGGVHRRRSEAMKGPRILGDFGPMSDQAAVKATLDDLFRGALARRPDAIALVDPADRADFTDGMPRRLTYAQAARAIKAAAARLR